MSENNDNENKKDRAMRDMIEEARCILPGLQAMFGFQTIAVFNERFNDLKTYAQICHVFGLVLLVVSMAMLMTPAVYYRAKRGVATSRMVAQSRRNIRGALIPLALGLSLGMLTVMSLATGNIVLSVVAAAACLGMFTWLWFLLPCRDSAL